MPARTAVVEGREVRGQGVHLPTVVTHHGFQLRTCPSRRPGGRAFARLTIDDEKAIAEHVSAGGRHRGRRRSRRRRTGERTSPQKAGEAQLESWPGAVQTTARCHPAPPDTT